MKSTFPHDPRSTALLLGVVVLIGGACDGEQRGTFQGRYVHAFEASAFTECGAAETWWTEFKASHPALDSAIAAEDRLEDQTDVYLVAEGRLSAKGSFGHLGASRRELTIESIESVRPWDPGLCQ